MKFQRPLKDQELTILVNRLKQLDKNFKSRIRFLFIWTLLVFAVGIFAYFKMDESNKALLLTATVGIYIGIGAWVVGEEYLKQQKERKSIAFLKNKNIVTAIEVRSDKFFQLDEEDDEGVYYLFQLANNKIFSFGGQDFYPNKGFPSDNFEIVEGRGLNGEIILLEIFNKGNKIEPTRIISGKKKWDLLNSPNYPNPDELTVVDGRIEDYASLLDKSCNFS